MKPTIRYDSISIHGACGGGGGVNGEWVYDVVETRNTHEYRTSHDIRMISHRPCNIIHREIHHSTVHLESRCGLATHGHNSQHPRVYLISSRLDGFPSSHLLRYYNTRHTASPSVRTLPYNKTRNERAESLRPTVGRYS